MAPPSLTGAWSLFSAWSLSSIIVVVFFLVGIVFVDGVVDFAARRGRALDMERTGTEERYGVVLTLHH